MSVWVQIIHLESAAHIPMRSTYANGLFDKVEYLILWTANEHLIGETERRIRCNQWETNENETMKHTKKIRKEKI